MTNERFAEITELTKLATLDTVKAQLAAGKPKSGMPKVRHIAIVSKVLVEILDSCDAEDKEQVIRACLSGNLLNCSQLRQDLERAGLLVKEQAAALDY